MKKLIYLLTIAVIGFACAEFSTTQTASISDNENRRVPAETIDGFVPKDSLSGQGNWDGKNPLVLIDGKEYPVSILKHVDPAKIASASSGKGRDDVKKYVTKAKDGVVDLKTLGGDFRYTSRRAWLNEMKELSIPEKKFFTRLRLQGEAGETYEKIIVKLPTGGSGSGRVKPNKMPLYLLGEQALDEVSFARLTPKQLEKVIGVMVLDGGHIDAELVKKYGERAKNGVFRLITDVSQLPNWAKKSK